MPVLSARPGTFQPPSGYQAANSARAETVEIEPLLTRSHPMPEFPQDPRPSISEFEYGVGGVYLLRLGPETWEPAGGGDETGSRTSSIMYDGTS